MDFTEENSTSGKTRRKIRSSSRRSADKPWYQRVLDNLKRRLRAQTASFRVHGFLFSAVSVLLIGLNLFTSPAQPWAYFPIAGWLIGLGGHFQAFWNRRRELSQMSQVPDLDAETGKLLRRYQKSMGAWGQHRTAFLLVNAFLWGINLGWSPGFLWAAIVTGAWGVGLGCHWLGNTARRKMLKSELGERGFDLAGLKSVLPLPAGFRRPRASGLAEKARLAKEELARKYRDDDMLRGRWSEVGPLLDMLADQIGELERKRKDFDELMRGFSVRELEDELESARRKQRLTSDDLLKKEYERSIVQYENHLKAALGLAHHRELLDLRLQSAFHLIKQLEIDTIRLRSVDSFASPSSLAALRAKTSETQAFLEDFKKSLVELENDF